MNNDNNKLENTLNLIEEDVEKVEIPEDDIEEIDNQDQFETTLTDIEINNDNSIKSDVNNEKEFVVESTNKVNDNKIIHKGLIIGLVFAFLGVCSVLAYYFIINNPTNYYKCLSKVLVDKIYLTNNYNANVYKQNIDFDVNLTVDSLDSNTLSLINDTTLNIERGVDKNNNKSYISIDSKYNKEKLIDLSLYLDEKNNKSYIYLKDYLDKYIELDSNTIKALTSILKESKSDNKKAKRIIKNEIIKQIKSSDTSKKDGYLVYTITNTELINKIKTILTNLSNNKEFINCYSDSEEVKNNLNKIIYALSNYSVDEELEIKLYAKKKSALNYNLKEFIIEYNSIKITFDMSNKTTKFNISRDNITLLSGTYLSNGKNNKNTVLTLDVPNMLTFELKINSKYEKLKTINFIDNNKVSTLDSLSAQEKITLMNNLKKSPIYNFISSISDDIAITGDSIAKSKALGYIDAIESYSGFYEAKKSGVVLDGYDTPIPQVANPNSKYIKCIKFSGSWTGGATNANCNNFFNAIDSLNNNKIKLNNGSIIYLTKDGKVVYNSVFVFDDYICKYDGKDINECIENN